MRSGTVSTILKRGIDQRMAKERILSGNVQKSDEAAASPALRPERLNEFVGQTDLVERLRIALEAAAQRGEAVEHLLLHGPPGLGKTTLAHIVAAEMGSRLYVTSGPALTRAGDLVGTLTKMDEKDVLFVDEIHRLPIAVEEYLYPAMEDFKIDFTLDSHLHARVMTYRLKPFTMIGATTQAGLLSGALRSRFGLTHHLQYYDRRELVEVLARAAGRLGIDGEVRAALEMIAGRSRGTPRIALRLLRRVRDFAQVRERAGISESTVDEALNLEGVDEYGLDALDRTYLMTMQDVYQGGPVGVEAMSATLGEDSRTLEDVVEPFLLQLGLVARTRQGRRITDRGASYLQDQGIERSTASGGPGGLFDG